MAVSATKFSSKSSWSRRIKYKKFKNGLLVVRKLPHACNWEHWVCASMTKLSLNTCLTYRISKIFKSDKFVSFEVKVKVELDLKFVRMVRWQTVIITFQKISKCNLSIFDWKGSKFQTPVSSRANDFFLKTSWMLWCLIDNYEAYSENENAYRRK